MACRVIVTPVGTSTLTNGASVELAGFLRETANLREDELEPAQARAIRQRARNNATDGFAPRQERASAGSKQRRDAHEARALLHCLHGGRWQPFAVSAVKIRTEYDAPHDGAKKKKRTNYH